MAKTRELPAATDAAAPEATAPEVVKLKGDNLGVKSRDFTPAHAKALLAFQEAKGYTDWQPVEDEPAA